ncbi:hypothetical protein CY35_12G088100 [Sphagnum magellanicum]|nr:hypothetical protein CY35_12G088100 [Sphagnum magellanicum]
MLGGGGCHNSSSSSSSTWGSAVGLHCRLHSFVKQVLIQQLVPSGALVCDLFCGRGTDMANWTQVEIGKYVGVDLSASALEDAREQWEKEGQPFPATFCELDPCMANLKENLKEDRLPADVVCCFAHLQDCFTSEDRVQRLLKNVSSLLMPGGYFFGATPDSSTIWYKYQKAVEEAMKAGSLRVNGTLPRVRTELYNISFEDDRFHEYGSKYQLRFSDDAGLPMQAQLLVHFPSLIRLAEEVGLEFLEIQNLTEFYEEYCIPFSDCLQSNCGILVDAKGPPIVDAKGRLSQVAQDVLSMHVFLLFSPNVVCAGLYTTFIFRKAGHRAQGGNARGLTPVLATEDDICTERKQQFPPHHIDDSEQKQLQLEEPKAADVPSTRDLQLHVKSAEFQSEQMLETSVHRISTLRISIRRHNRTSDKQNALVRSSENQQAVKDPNSHEQDTEIGEALQKDSQIQDFTRKKRRSRSARITKNAFSSVPTTEETQVHGGCPAASTIDHQLDRAPMLMLETNASPELSVSIPMDGSEGVAQLCELQPNQSIEIKIDKQAGTSIISDNLATTSCKESFPTACNVKEVKCDRRTRQMNRGLELPRDSSVQVEPRVTRTRSLNNSLKKVSMAQRGAERPSDFKCQGAHTSPLDVGKLPEEPVQVHKKSKRKTRKR